MKKANWKDLITLVAENKRWATEYSNWMGNSIWKYEEYAQLAEQTTKLIYSKFKSS